MKTVILGHFCATLYDNYFSKIKKPLSFDQNADAEKSIGCLPIKISIERIEQNATSNITLNDCILFDPKDRQDLPQFYNTVFNSESNPNLKKTIDRTNFISLLTEHQKLADRNRASLYFVLSVENEANNSYGKATSNNSSNDSHKSFDNLETLIENEFVEKKSEQCLKKDDKYENMKKHQNEIIAIYKIAESYSDSTSSELPKYSLHTEANDTHVLYFRRMEQHLSPSTMLSPKNSKYTFILNQIYIAPAIFPMQTSYQTHSEHSPPKYFYASSIDFDLQMRSAFEQNLLSRCISDALSIELYQQIQKLFVNKSKHIKNGFDNIKHKTKTKTKRQKETKSRRGSKQKKEKIRSLECSSTKKWKERSGLVLIVRALKTSFNVKPSYTIIGQYTLQRKKSNVHRTSCLEGTERTETSIHKTERNGIVSSEMSQHEYFSSLASCGFNNIDQKSNEKKIPDKINRNSDHYVITADEKTEVTDYLFLLMAQMKPCVFSEADRRQRNRNNSSEIEIGYPGMRCRHCGGIERGNYFPLSCRNLQASPPIIYNHLIGCPSVFIELKKSILSTKSKHKDQLTRIKSTQVSFFERTWQRLHHPSLSNEGKEGIQAVNSIVQQLIFQNSSNRHISDKVLKNKNHDHYNIIAHNNRNTNEHGNYCEKRREDKANFSIEKKEAALQKSEYKEQSVNNESNNPPPDDIDLDLDLGIILDVLAEEDDKFSNLSSTLPFEFGSKNISFDYSSCSEMMQHSYFQHKKTKQLSHW